MRSVETIILGIIPRISGSFETRLMNTPICMAGSFLLRATTCRQREQSKEYQAKNAYQTYLACQKVFNSGKACFVGSLVLLGWTADLKVLLVAFQGECLLLIGT